MGQLLETVRDHLRTQLSLDNAQCGVHLDGEPPPRAGQKYVAIYEGGTAVWTGDQNQLGERYQIGVTIMRRAGEYPLDRMGDLLFRETTAIKSLEQLERETVAAIHGSQSLRVTYNTELTAPDTDVGNIAIMPLFYTGRGPTRIATTQTERANLANAYLRRDLRFAGMDRLQKNENIA